MFKKGVKIMIFLKDTKTYDFNKADELWFIVRKPNNQMLSLINSSKKCKWVPELSPSNQLFQQYLTWRSSGQWNTDTFLYKYTPQFLKELKYNPKAHAALETLKETDKNKRIELVCFCHDETLCHRSIMGGILLFQNKEIITCDSSYIKYGLMS